jgi:hypothetical protein
MSDTPTLAHIRNRLQQASFEKCPFLNGFQPSTTVSKKAGPFCPEVPQIARHPQCPAMLEADLQLGKIRRFEIAVGAPYALFCFFMSHGQTPAITS